MKTKGFENYKRVDKRTARRKFAEGETLRLVPANMSPTQTRGTHKDIKVCDERTHIESAENQFDFHVYSFIAWKCNTMRGKYPAYYVREEEKK